MGFGDGDQLDFTRIAARLARGGSDKFPNALQTAGKIVHQGNLS
jgi:hypothetical protein